MNAAPIADEKLIFAWRQGQRENRFIARVPGNFEFVRQRFLEGPPVRDSTAFAVPGDDRLWVQAETHTSDEREGGTIRWSDPDGACLRLARKHGEPPFIAAKFDGAEALITKPHSKTSVALAEVRGRP